MQSWIAAFLFGVLGGAAGALSVGLLGSHAAQQADPGAAADPAPSREVLRRLDAIDRRLEALGSVRAVAPASGGGADVSLSGGTAEDRLLQRIEARVAQTMESKWGELSEGRSSSSEEAVEEKKPRLPLAEVARELELTSGEEARLREIYKEAEDKFLAILAEPDGDPEAIREEIRTAAESGDEGAGMTLMTRYLPKVFPKIGEVMAIQMDRERKIRETVGPERADRLDGYDIVEADPLGLSGNRFNIRASSRGER